MDFFDRQEQARQRTRLLLFLFTTAVVAVLVVNYLVFATVIEPFLKPLPHARHKMGLVYSIFWLAGEVLTSPLFYLKWLWDPFLAGCIALGTLLSISLGCWYKIRVLSEGGSAVAELLNGRCLEPATTDPDEQRLRNVVEEMAIASGMPVPEVYLLDNERGINAFAAGHTRQDVAIGVTRGCLKLLTRDELQGVIAHEFSHVLNGDTRLNMELMALAHGLFWPTYLGRLLTRGTTAAPESYESYIPDGLETRLLPTAPLGLVFLVLGSTSLPFVRLLKSAVCRQREWLADASAVQFTRNPEGIAGALKKIGGLWRHGRLDTPMAEVASHLYFANNAVDSWLPFLSTHPPLARRIAAIDPSFDGMFPKVAPLKPNQFERDQQFEKVASGIMMAERLVPEAWLGTAGAIAEHQIRQAAILRLDLPDEMKDQIPNPDGAAAILYGLLLSDDESIRARQMELLQAGLEPEAYERAVALAAAVDTLQPQMRLPVAELAVASLRRSEGDEITRFCQLMQQLIESDGAIELFEYTLMKMVQRRLLGGTAIWSSQAKGRPCGVREVLPDCTLLLSALAHVGHDTERDARKAFEVGLESLDAPGAQLEFMPRSDWDLNKVDAALGRLVHCSPSARRNILIACGKTVVADGRVGVREAELLRSIADSLDCPMPPFVEAVRSEAVGQSN